MTRMIFVNLPVADVEKSAEFYRALGFEKNEQFSQQGQAASMVWSDAIYVMLLSHDFFRGFLPGGKTIADTRGTTEALIALSFDGKEAVDAVTDAAGDAGGKADVRDKQDLGFMYSRAFEDLDGHIFEAVWMNVDAAVQAGEIAAA